MYYLKQGYTHQAGDRVQFGQGVSVGYGLWYEHASDCDPRCNVSSKAEGMRLSWARAYKFDHTHSENE